MRIDNDNDEEITMKIDVCIVTICCSADTNPVKSLLQQKTRK